MTDRDCANCKHHTEDGCSSWDCEFEPKDLISRADAVKTVIRMCSPICAWQVGTQQYPDCVVAEINALPSADADGEDLIIKGAKGIQDGLYNIKDGKLFKYKAKGGTVRTYERSK